MRIFLTFVLLFFDNILWNGPPYPWRTHISKFGLGHHDVGEPKNTGKQSRVEMAGPVARRSGASGRGGLANGWVRWRANEFGLSQGGQRFSWYAGYIQSRKCGNRTLLNTEKIICSWLSETKIRAKVILASKIEGKADITKFIEPQEFRKELYISGLQGV